jgi:hypothetical protein
MPPGREALASGNADKKTAVRDGGKNAEQNTGNL